MESGVTIVIPAYNESDSLAENLSQWIRECDVHDWKIIIVDDGSTDGSEGVLASYLDNDCLEIYRHKTNRGYGSALKTGLSEVSTGIAVTMDADGQHSIKDAQAIVEHMLSSDSDMVIGSREGMMEESKYRRIGKAIIRRITRVLFATTIYDLNSGFKSYNAKIVKSLLPLSPNSMAFSDIVTLLHLHMGLRVTEYPVQVRARFSGASTISTMTAFQTVMEIINVVMWFSPSRIFFPIASVLLLLGILWAVPFLLIGRGLSTAALLLMLSGIMGYMLALLAEQLAWIRKMELPTLRPEKMRVSDKAIENGVGQPDPEDEAVASN